MAELTKDLPIKNPTIVSINLKLTNADVYIYNSDTFDFEIKTDTPFTIQESTGSINIVQPNNSTNAKVKLYLSNNTLNINIINHNGDIKINDITCESANFIISSGDIEITCDVEPITLDYHNTNGDVAIDITCEDIDYNKLSVTNYNGDIEID